MVSLNIIIVCLIAFAVGIFSVSTGGTSLITVPALIWLGMSPQEAIATNMFALIFFSLAGAIGFRKEARLADYKEILLLLLLTVIGSFIGANIILVLNQNMIKKLIAVIICLIAASLLLKKDLGIQQRKSKPKAAKFIFGGIVIFILGIYGGFFSGGYVTLLSYALILFFSYSFLQAAFITKVFNVFSSLAASILFCYYGLINFSLAVPLAASMSFGAILGSRLAVLKGNLWIRNLFILFIIALAIKLIAF